MDLKNNELGYNKPNNNNNNNGSYDDSKIKESIKEINSQLEQNTNSINNKMLKYNIYISDYLKGDGVLRSIKQVDSSITLEQVRALNGNATLDSSYDWYIIQKIINEAPNHSTIIFDGTYVINTPITIKRGHLTFNSLKKSKAERSVLKYTLTDKTTTFITIGLLGNKQLQYLYFNNLQFRGTLDYATGNYSGNCIDLDNTVGNVKSDCQGINFNMCDFVNFKNGIYVKSAYYISSQINDCYFGYNVENGFYGKHTGLVQINNIVFSNVGCLCNGLDANNNFKDLTEGNFSGINISGVGCSIINGDTSFSPYGTPDA